MIIKSLLQNHENHSSFKEWRRKDKTWTIKTTSKKSWRTLHQSVWCSHLLEQLWRVVTQNGRRSLNGIQLDQFLVWHVHTSMKVRIEKEHGMIITSAMHQHLEFKALVWDGPLLVSFFQFQFFLYRVLKSAFMILSRLFFIFFRSFQSIMFVKAVLRFMLVFVRKSAFS